MIRFLPIPLLAAILLPLNAENPVRNASFELGCGDWDLVRFSRQDTVFRDAVSDASNPVHGTKSLRIENPDADTIELSGREVLLKKNHTYTLSWYAKTSLCGSAVPWSQKTGRDSGLSIPHSSIRLRNGNAINARSPHRRAAHSSRNSSGETGTGPLIQQHSGSMRSNWRKAQSRHSFVHIVIRNSARLSIPACLSINSR